MNAAEAFAPAKADYAGRLAARRWSIVAVGIKMNQQRPMRPLDYMRVESYCKPTGNLTLALVCEIAGLAAGRGQRSAIGREGVQ